MQCDMNAKGERERGREGDGEENNDLELYRCKIRS